MTNQTDKVRVPGWFSLIPALKEIQQLAELSGEFARCFEQSNEVLLAEILFWGGNVDDLQKPVMHKAGGLWYEDLVEQQHSLVKTFIYRNALMARLVMIVGGNLEGITFREKLSLPQEFLPKLIALMREISLQMQIYNKLELKRFQALSEKDE